MCFSDKVKLIREKIVIKIEQEIGQLDNKQILSIILGFKVSSNFVSITEFTK